MPCIRSIELFVTTRPDNERIPEYFHPDSSCARVLETGDPRRVNPSRSELAHTTPPGSEAGSYCRELNPTVSVYMPSAAGVYQFRSLAAVCTPYS